MKTPISYYGGKQTLLKHILPLIPRHNLYTEAFCGGCAVLFAKDPVECEVINDINNELINFYAIMKREPESLQKEIEATLHSRELHVHARHISLNPYFFSPVQRAWATWVASKMSFASKLDGPFGYDRNGTTSKKVDNAKANFTNGLCARLGRVTIEHENGLSIIKRYDCKEAFHFVDPPYINSCCGHYAGTFNVEDLANLLNVLSEVKGKFMLTMFPNDTIQKYVDRFSWRIYKVERTISASKTSRRKQEEWIIMNY